MNKLIKFLTNITLLILIFLTVQSSAQLDTSVWVLQRNSIDGKFDLMYNKVTWMGYDSGKIHIPINISGDKNFIVKQTDETQLLTTVYPALNWFTRFRYGFTDTTSAAGDTLSRRFDAAGTSNSIADVFPVWAKFTIITDDTIEVSADAAFPAYLTTPVLPSTVIEEKEYDTQTINNLFYRRKGTNGAPHVIIYAWGR